MSVQGPWSADDLVLIARCIAQLVGAGNRIHVTWYRSDFSPAHQVAFDSIGATVQHNGLPEQKDGRSWVFVYDGDQPQKRIAMHSIGCNFYLARGPAIQQQKRGWFASKGLPKWRTLREFTEQRPELCRELRKRWIPFNHAILTGLTIGGKFELVGCASRRPSQFDKEDMRAVLYDTATWLTTDTQLDFTAETFILSSTSQDDDISLGLSSRSARKRAEDESALLIECFSKAALRAGYTTGKGAHGVGVLAALIAQYSTGSLFVLRRRESERLNT